MSDSYEFATHSPVPGSDPDVSRPRLMRNTSFLEADRREIALRRGRHNQLGFAYQVAFVRVLGRFPQRRPWRLTGRSCGSPPCSWEPTPRRSTPTPVGSRRSPTISTASASTCAWVRSMPPGSERLARFLEDEALRLEPRTTPGTAPPPDHTRPASGRSSIAAAKNSKNLSTATIR